MYKESQKITQVWIWMILFIIEISLLSAFYVAITGKIVANIQHLLSQNILIAILIFFNLFLLFVYKINLRTTIDISGIEWSMYPFIRSKKYNWNTISKIYVKKYSPLKEFGGWGIRSNSNGECFTIKGIYGIQLELKSGNKILIGTQNYDSSELKAILQLIEKNLYL